MKIAIVGAGWAGLSAAITATQNGHAVTVFEAARTAGGRARSVGATLPDGPDVLLDNGQHILIGAYTETLRLLRAVDVNTDTALLRQPLALIDPDGQGLRLPALPGFLPASWPVLAGVLRQRAWPLRERLGLLRTALRWQGMGFSCEENLSVAQLCSELGPRVRAELIAPLCVSALNTPADEASAQVFLRVLRDALFAVPGGSDLLLPRMDLGALFPQAALRWLQARGTTVRLGQRVDSLDELQGFDAVILACPAQEAARLVEPRHRAWAAQARALRHTSIATVYACGLQTEPALQLPEPMLALHASAEHPAQFVFDQGLLGKTPGLLAFVVSASEGRREEIEARVLSQARAQLRLDLQAVQTLIEKRATFACTPGLQRPPMQIAPDIAPGLLACGDYVAGPYPATLEGAVRSGVAAVKTATHAAGNDKNAQ